MPDNIHVTLESPSSAEAERLLHHRLDNLSPGRTRFFMRKALA